MTIRFRLLSLPAPTYNSAMAAGLRPLPEKWMHPLPASTACLAPAAWQALLGWLLQRTARAADTSNLPAPGSK
jgi:hypothetical protein